MILTCFFRNLSIIVVETIADSIITLLSVSFEDRNECELQIDGCSQNCTNVHCNDGKYICSCVTGYQLQSDKRACKGQLLFMIIIEGSNVRTIITCT